MIVSKTRGNPVDVAAAMRQAGTNVIEQARAKFDADIASYREGVRRMVENDGTLPPDEADVLLKACRDLDIPVERMEQDVVTLIRHGRVVVKIADTQARNLKRGEHAQQLEQALAVERQHWGVVRVDCDQRLKAAGATVDAAQLAYEKASRIPDERVHEQQAEQKQLEEMALYLFGPVEPEQLRRIVRPAPAAGIHPWK